MSEIICKCGHGADEHTEWGCEHKITRRLFCSCDKTKKTFVNIETKQAAEIARLRAAIASADSLVDIYLMIDSVPLSALEEVRKVLREALGKVEDGK